MIVEIIRYRIEDARRTEFEEAYASAAASLLRSPHCLGWELVECADEAGVYVLRIEWDSPEGHLEGFRKGPDFPPFLALVRPFVPFIEEMRHYRPTAVSARKMGGGLHRPGAPSLYEWAGGLAAFEKLFARFYERVAGDEVIGPVFARMAPEHSKHVAAFVAEVFGGPKRYSAELGGHPAMIRKHLGKNLSEAQRAQWVRLLLATADELGLPANPEFRSAFVGYLEWGSRIALVTAAPGATVEEEAPMPAWGWGEAGGPYRP